MKVPRHAVFGSLLASGLLAAQGSLQPKRAVEIRIGEIDSLSGVLAAQGTGVHEGVVYAVSEANYQIVGRACRLVRPAPVVPRDELPLEHLWFDGHGDPLRYEVGIFQIQKGRHVLLYPRDRATGKVVGPKP